MRDVLFYKIINGSQRVRTYFGTHIERSAQVMFGGVRKIKLYRCGCRTINLKYSSINLIGLDQHPFVDIIGFRRVLSCHLKSIVDMLVQIILVLYIEVCKMHLGIKRRDGEIEPTGIGRLLFKKCSVRFDICVHRSLKAIGTITGLCLHILLLRKVNTGICPGFWRMYYIILTSY